MNITSGLEDKFENVMIAVEELKTELQAMENEINDLSGEAVDIEDYQGLKDDIADYIIAVQTDNEDGQAIMLRNLMAYFMRDECENIAKEIEKAEGRSIWD